MFSKRTGILSLVFGFLTGIRVRSRIFRFRDFDEDLEVVVDVEVGQPVDEAVVDDQRDLTEPVAPGLAARISPIF